MCGIYPVYHLHSGEMIDDLIPWMAFWPWSFLWTMLHDLFYKFWKFLVETLSGAYNNISKSMFKEFNEFTEEK